MLRRAGTLLLVSASLIACSDQEAQRPLAPAAATLPPPPSIPQSQHYTAHLIAEAHEHLSAAEDAATRLEQSVHSLIAHPENDNLELSRALWRDAYNHYLISQATMRLPISPPPEWRDAGLTREDLERQLNSWPIESGYIDYLDGYPYSGLVNDTSLAINETTLSEQHQFADDTYVSIGFHAIEFLLWGEQGLRDASDYDRSVTTLPDEEDLAVMHQTRRGDYLLYSVRLLRQQVQRLRMRWTPDTGYYASRLQEIRPEKTLQASLLTAQQLLSEELLNRYLAYDSSPFSGQSRADISALITGLAHLLLPEDTSAGLHPMLAQRPLLADELQSGFAGADECLTDWDLAGTAEEARRNCRQRLIELLSVLDGTGQQLGIGLPLSE